MRREVLAVFFSFVSASSFSAGQPSRSRSPQTALRFEPYAIVSPYGAPVVHGELGKISLLENRTSGSPRRIELAFIRIPSTARRPGSPIVWLAGGPGWSG